MEPMPQGGDGVDIVIVIVVPVASIVPLGVPRLGVGAGALEAPSVGALAMVVLFRAKKAKTSAPPQKSVRAGTVGGIRPRQVPWTIAARSCSRRLLGLGGPGLTPPCPRHQAGASSVRQVARCSANGAMESYGHLI